MCSPFSNTVHILSFFYFPILGLSVTVCMFMLILQHMITWYLSILYNICTKKEWKYTYIKHTCLNTCLYIIFHPAFSSIAW